MSGVAHGRKPNWPKWRIVAVTRRAHKDPYMRFKHIALVFTVFTQPNAMATLSCKTTGTTNSETNYRALQIPVLN